MTRFGGARRGLNAWLVQRASALLMALLLPGFAIYALAHAPLDHAAWQALFAPLSARVAALLLIGAMLAHAWVGLREILIDYVHALWARLTLYLAFSVLYAACLIWAVDILWSAR